MKKLLRYGRFGSFYGSWAGAAAGVLIALYGAGDTLYHWPEDGTVRWFIEGTLSLSISFFIGGYILGLIGGFVFGLVGSISSHPLGWSISGIVGGFVSSWLCMWLMWSTMRKPAIPDFPTFWLNSLPNSLPIGLAPCVILGVVGWLIGKALQSEHPNIPHLNCIQRQ